jgi:hypothetical protein
MYFTKKVNDSLLITCLNAESRVIVLSGEYLDVWERVKIEKWSNDFSDHFNQHPLVGPDAPLAEFFQFLNEAHIPYSYDIRSLTPFSGRILNGSFEFLEVDERESQYAVYGTGPGASMNGTDGYGSAEVCEGAPCE